MKISKLKYEISHGLNTKDETILAKHEFQKYTQGDIQETNDFWFFLGEFNSKDFKESSEQDIDHDVVVYVNLENEKMLKTINKEEQIRFEENNTVIKTGESYDWVSYYKIRDNFFMDCIRDGQDIAVQRVLSRKDTK